jgi:hypothetical protein
VLECRGGRGVRSVDVRALLGDDAVYEAAAAEAFPEYNKARLVSLELPDRSGDVSTSVADSHPVSSSVWVFSCSYYVHRDLNQLFCKSY